MNLHTSRRYPCPVMRGLDPRIHRTNSPHSSKRWIAGSSPAMTIVSQRPLLSILTRPENVDGGGRKSRDGESQQHRSGTARGLHPSEAESITCLCNIVCGCRYQNGGRQRGNGETWHS